MSTDTETFSDLLAASHVMIVCGTGGVGKTTTSAAAAVAAAEAGRRAVVVTIDPAKRLADALGIAQLGNTPTEIEGPWPGTLAALMLDTRSTFACTMQASVWSKRMAIAIMKWMKW